MTDLQRDLKNTIAHITGQGVVALSFGCEIHLAVDPAPSGDRFVGCCWARIHGVSDMPDHMKRAIGVSGPIAELAFTRGSPDDVEAAEAFEKLQAGEIPLSADEAAMVEGYTLADVSYSIDILRGRWAAVEEEVRRMTPAILNHTTHFH